MKTLDTRAYLDMICGLLAQGQTGISIPVAGSSMAPFLHHGDAVYLEPPGEALKKGDIVLYTRPGGQYVLHRIVRVNPDGSFLMLGDAQQELERIEGRDQIHGRVTAVRHRGALLTPEDMRWRFFATAWIPLRPWRRKIMGTIAKLKSR